MGPTLVRAAQIADNELLNEVKKKGNDSRLLVNIYFDLEDSLTTFFNVEFFKHHEHHRWSLFTQFCHEQYLTLNHTQSLNIVVKDCKLSKIKRKQNFNSTTPSSESFRASLHVISLCSPVHRNHSGSAKCKWHRITEFSPAAGHWLANLNFNGVVRMAGWIFIKALRYDDHSLPVG